MQLIKIPGWHREYEQITDSSLATITINKEGHTFLQVDVYTYGGKKNYEPFARAGIDITQRLNELKAAQRRGILFTKTEQDDRKIPMLIPQHEDPMELILGTN